MTIFFTWTSSSKSEIALDSGNRITNGRQGHMVEIRKCIHVDLLRSVHSRPRRAVRNPSSYTIRKRSILALGIEASSGCQVHVPICLKIWKQGKGRQQTVVVRTNEFAGLALGACFDSFSLLIVQVTRIRFKLRLKLCVDGFCSFAVDYTRKVSIEISTRSRGGGGLLTRHQLRLEDQYRFGRNWAHSVVSITIHRLNCQRPLIANAHIQ